jgi:monoamine oxidase
MKRRELLKQLGFGLTAGLALPSVMFSCAKDDPGPEVPFDGTVAIIGAGAAGLYTADILRSKGINVVIFEASSQLGGRIRSLRNQRDSDGNPIESIADFPVETGAEFIYGTDSVWNEIVKNLNVPELVLNTNSDVYILGDEVKSATDWGADTDFADVKNFVDGLPTYTGGAVSIEQAAGVSPRAANLLNAWAANSFGSTSSRVGAQGIAESLAAITHNNQRVIISTNPMQDVLVSRFSDVKDKVRLNTPITSINYSGGRVVLTDKSGTQTEFEKVVVTVPLAVLKAGGISFSPALPGTNTGAFSKIGMDACVRVVLDFKKNFWGDSTGLISGGDLVPQYFNSGVGRSQFFRTLTATITGPKAEAISLLGANAIPSLLAELDVLYNNQATEFVRRDLNTNQIISFIFDWTKDEYVKGGFSYPLVNGSLQSRADLGAPIAGKVFFAGEATDISGNAGTINGALLSAERASAELIESILNPAS